jgi:hypothetical protein
MLMCVSIFTICEQVSINKLSVAMRYCVWLFPKIKSLKRRRF